METALFVGSLIGSANVLWHLDEQFGSSPEECNLWVLIDQKTGLMVCVPVKAFASRKAKGNHCLVLVTKKKKSPAERLNCNAEGGCKRVFWLKTPPRVGSE